MRRKVTDLSQEEYLTIVTRKRKRAIQKYKEGLKKRGRVYNQRSDMTSTILRMNSLEDSDLEDEELIRGVFTEGA